MLQSKRGTYCSFSDTIVQLRAALLSASGCASQVMYLQRTAVALHHSSHSWNS
jgi:hypothetical protein